MGSSFHRDMLYALRSRPGLYIGNTSWLGARQMVLALVEDARRRCLTQVQDGRIDIILYESNSARVEDNGVGVPLAQIPMVATVATPLELEPFDFPPGPVVWIIGLSSHCVHTSYSEGQAYQQQFFRGQPIKSLRYLSNVNMTHTIRHFTPDPTIFKEPFPLFDKFVEPLQELAACNPGLKISLTDHRTNDYQLFHYPNGMADYLREVFNIQTIRLHAKLGKDQVDLAFGVAQQRAGTWGFARGELNPEGGTHVKGLEQGVMQVIRSYTKTHGWNTTGKRPTVYDLRKNLVAVVSVLMPDPYYNYSTKVEYATPRATSLVQRLIVKELAKRFDENPVLAKIIIDALYKL